MSKTVFIRSFVNPLVNRLKQERRASIVGQQGQVILLPDISAVSQAIQVLFHTREGGATVTLSNAQAEQALQAGIAKAKELQERFKKQKPRKGRLPPIARYNAMVKAIPYIPEWKGFTHNEDLFIVSSYKSSTDTILEAILKSLKEQKVLNNIQSEQVRGRVDKGHGVSGLAVSQVQIAGAINYIGQKVSKEEFQLFKGALKSKFLAGELTVWQYQQLDTLFTRYKHIVTKSGKLKANYVSVLAYQLYEHNREVDKKDEVELKKVFENFVNEVGPDILNLKGSSTLKDKIERVIVESATPKIKKTKNTRVTIKSKALKAELVSSAKAKHKFKEEKPKIQSKTHRFRDPQTGRFIGKEQAQSPYNLLAILNAKLPDVVASHMHWPRLRYRTGRFASSVRATDVQTTPQGYPSIGYTYMKYPYQTFEVGYAQGTEERDPRPLIDMSIREIASTMAMGRFFTRRV